MLRHLRIDNLKAFKGRHEIELAPLTLIYGANSSGKSTIIQALLLLKQTLESSDPEQPDLVIRGNLADLGSFLGILHQHQQRLPLAMGIEVETNTHYPRHLSSARRRVDLVFEWDESTRVVRQTKATLSDGGTEFASLTRRRGPKTNRKDRPARSGPRETVFRIGVEAARRHFASWALEAISSRASRSGETFREQLASREQLLEDLVHHVTYAFSAWGILPGYPAFKAKPTGDESRDEALVMAVSAMEDLIWEVTYVFRQEFIGGLDSLIYLGPLRQAPERFHLLSGARRASVGREGEYAAELLSRTPQLVTDVNNWFSQLQIPYEVEPTTVGDVEVRHSLGDVVALQLTDQRSGIRVSPSDVGFGISQLLPIVVQSLTSFGGTICIEQPEIHVHPRLQAEMADLFIEAVQGRQNQLIIETHSENLMLRLQRRIKEGRIPASSVRILYVDVDDEGAADVLSLRLDNEGNFLDEWPQGFFEERFEELFGADAADVSE